MSTPRRELPPPPARSLSFEDALHGTEEETVEQLREQLRQLTLQVTSQAETIEQLRHASSGASAHASPDRGAPTSASAVEQLAQTIAQTIGVGRSRESVLAARAKTLADLLRNAPKFTGSSDIWLWKKRITEYMHRRGIEDERMQVDILLEACEGSASEYLGSLEWPIDTVDQFWSTMEVRFQRNEFARMADYEGLRQKAGQTYRAYADALFEKSYGLGIPRTALLRKFLLTMHHSAELRRFFIPHLEAYGDVRELAAAVEQMSSAEEDKPVDKSKTKCRVCGKTGHFAVSCPLRRRQQTTQQSTRPTQPVATADIPEQSSELVPYEPQEVVEHVEYSEEYEYEAEDLADYEEVGVTDVWPAEKRPADSSGQHQEALKRLRTAVRPQPSRGQTSGLPPPPPTRSAPLMASAPQRVAQPQVPSRPTTQLQPVPLRGYRAPVPRMTRPATMPVRARMGEGQKSLGRVLQGSVDVPAALLAGLVLRASGRPAELAASWAATAEQEARRLLQQPETSITETSTMELVESTEICTLGTDESVVNPLNVGDQRRYVGYMPIRLGGSPEIWWALIDTGAQVSVISAGLASYAGLYDDSMANVLSGVKVSGYNDASSYLPVLQTQLRLGAKGGDERWVSVHLCLFDTNKYKLIIGVDLLHKWQFIYESPQRRLHLTCNGSTFSLPVASREYAFRARSVQEYHDAVRVTRPAADLVEVATTIEEVVEEALESRYESSLSWLSREYVEREPALLPVAYTAQVTADEPTYSSDEDVDIPDSEGEDTCDELTVSALESAEVTTLSTLPTAEDISAQQFAEVSSTLPQQHSAGDMGMAQLPQTPVIALSDDALSAFMQKYGLRPVEGKTSLAHRAAKLQQAIEGNPQLVDASRTPEQHTQVYQMLLGVADVFATSLTDLEVPADTEEFRIDTGSAAPIKQKAFRMGQREVEFLNKTILGQLEAKIVVPSQSAWRSPAFVAYARHYGTEGPPKMRKVIDFRKVNAVTRSDTYPLPDIPELLEWFSSSRYFGAIDLKSGYWQTRTHADDACKTAFVVPGSLHEYVRVPFGLKNAPAFFQRAITSLLSSSGIRHSRGFVDDLMTGGSSWDEYLSHQQHLLSTLRDSHWLVTPSKVRLGYEEIAVLGHCVGHQYVKPDPEKIQAIQRITAPQNVGGIRAFIGLTGYYRRFIPNFARIAKPLTCLTAKDVPFTWGPEQEHAFRELQRQLTEVTLLHTPTSEGKFRVYTDFSSDAIAAALHQIQDGQERPIAFVSRLCRGPERTLSSAEGELCALVYALGKFRSYLGYDSFDVITDSHALLSLRTNQNLSSKLTRWSVLLSEFNFTLIHKPGTAHRNADGLSRCPQQDALDEQSHVHVWQLSQRSHFLEEDTVSLQGPGTHQDDHQGRVLEVNNLQAETHTDCHACGRHPEGRMLMCGRCGSSWHSRCIPGRQPPCYYYCQECTASIEASGGPADITEDVAVLRGLLGGPRPDHYAPEQWREITSYYVVRRGQLLYEGETGYRVYPAPVFRARLIEEYHASLMHAGWRATCEALRERYYWPSMESDVRTYCRGCLSCQLEQAVFRRSDYLSGHLTSPQPRVAWSMDCAPAIATSQGRQSILIMVDDFTRYVIAVRIPQLTSAAVRQAFVERVLTVYGKPSRVRTDNGREFEGDFAALLAALGIERIRTRPVSPWTNGRAERMVRRVKQLIRRSLFAVPVGEWTEMLPWVVSAINMTVSRSVGYSPHEVFFGEPPRVVVPASIGAPVSIHLGEESPEAVTQYVRRIRQQIRVIQQRAREMQEQYEAGLEQDYASYPVAGKQYSGESQMALKRPHPTYARGALVMVKRMRGALGPHSHHFALKAAGPFIVLEDKGDSVLLQGATGQRKWQNKANVLPLRQPLV